MPRPTPIPIHAQFIKIFNEINSLTDSLNKNISKTPFTEVINLSDIINKIITKTPFTETMGFSDEVIPVLIRLGDIKRLISVQVIKPGIDTILNTKPTISGIDDIKPRLNVISIP